MRACLLQRDSQIRRNSGFSNATLSAGDRDHVLDAGNARCANACSGAAGRCLYVDQDFCAANTIERAQSFLGVMLDGGRNVWIIGCERELHFHFAIAYLNIFDQTEGDDVAAEAGIAHRAQRIENLFLRNRHCF